MTVAAETEYKPLSVDEMRELISRLGPITGLEYARAIATASALELLSKRINDYSWESHRDTKAKASERSPDAHLSIVSDKEMDAILGKAVRYGLGADEEARAIAWIRAHANGIKDPVERPAHYTQGDIECIDAIKAQLSPDEYRGFLRGQVAKYNWRVGLKGSALEDAQKAQWYFSRLVRELGGGK